MRSTAGFTFGTYPCGSPWGSLGEKFSGIETVSCDQKACIFVLNCKIGCWLVLSVPVVFFLGEWSFDTHEADGFPDARPRTLSPKEEERLDGLVLWFVASSYVNLSTFGSFHLLDAA